jgi:mitotic spindle assembly checkpoint protein MAD2
MASKAPEKDKSKVHKLSLKGSAKLVAEFVSLDLNLTPLQSLHC